jgi:hypothetical protein
MNSLIGEIMNPFQMIDNNGIYQDTIYETIIVVKNHEVFTPVIGGLKKFDGVVSNELMFIGEIL